MPRSAALANQIADALKASMLLINGTTSPNAYLTTPQTVQRGVRGTDLSQGPSPLIAIEVVAVRSGADTMGESHAFSIDFEIHCVNRSATDAERGVLNLCADVEYQLTQNEQLGGLLLEPIVDYTVALNVELSQIAGLAVFTLSFTAKTRFDHSTTLP